MRIKLLLLPVILLMTALSLLAQDEKYPNILLFHADDMTWRDCEPYGNMDVKTPAISRLAAEGVCFDNMHTSTAMCSPTRQQLYTGLFPARSGAYPNHSMVKFGVKSACHYFDELGYRVALIGKVHHNPVESFPFEFLGGRHHDDGSGTDIYLERIKPLINQDENPFFLVVSTNQPHSPWNRGDAGRYDKNKISVPDYMVDCDETRESLVKYYAEITYADSLLGQCIKYLEEAGKADNTIIIFTSEQGSSFPFAKWTCYDLGLKTAFIVRWPGKILEGTRNDALTQYVDVIPTLLEAAGKNPGEIETGAVDTRGYMGFDGKSFLEVMSGRETEHRDYVYGIHTTRGIYSGSVCYPVRSVRSKRYKYILNLNSSATFHNLATNSNLYRVWLDITVNNSEKNDFVARYLNRPREELYDILNDPYEMINLAGEKSCENIKRELAAALNDWMDQQGDRGIDTEMKALDRQLMFDEDSWKGYDEQLNMEILNQKK